MSKVETSPFGGFQKLPFPLVRKNGFRLAAGSVKAARRLCARRREALTGSAASSTIGARGNGSDPSEIKGHFYFAQREHFYFAATAFIFFLFFWEFRVFSG
jgi:hypothetical protein